MGKDFQTHGAGAVTDTGTGDGAVPEIVCRPGNAFRVRGDQVGTAENGLDGPLREVPFHRGENVADAVVGTSGEYHQPCWGIHHTDLLLREGIQDKAAVRALHDRGGMDHLFRFRVRKVSQKIHMRSDLYAVICQTAEAGQPLLEEPGCLHGRAYQLQRLGIGFLLRRVAPVIPPLPDEKAAMGINGYVRRKLLRQAQKTTAVIPVVVAERHGSDPPEVDAQLLRVPQAGVPLPGVEQQTGISFLQVDGQAEFPLKAGVQNGVF